MLAEFDLNLSLYRLNLSNNIAKAARQFNRVADIQGVKMPLGYRKTLYLDRLNSTNGICIKDEDINSVDEISDNCNSENEFKIECDGTLQGAYRCTYNSSAGNTRLRD